MLSNLQHDLFGRGPLHFRYVMQPAVAIGFATIYGMRDARAGRVPFGWAIATQPDERNALLLEGWKHIGRVFIAAVVVDLLFQVLVRQRISFLQSIIVAVLLAVVPYAIVRGPANRIARFVFNRRASAGPITRE